MCELFGFSSKYPLAVSVLPLAEFRTHGGDKADNPDGWGMVWRADDDLRLEKEPFPGCHSARFDNLINTVQSGLIVAHLRKARFPPINTLGNTHPFIHACCEQQWVFAHNGMVPGVVAAESAQCNAVCQPAGQTDSEFAFCHLLRYLTGHYQTPGTDDEWLGILSTVSEQIAAHGKFNFLLSDGKLLIAYGHDRLHYQESADTGFPSVMIATEPLGDKASWTSFAPGELLIYLDGVQIKQVLTHPPLAPVPESHHEQPDLP
jgi:predicted glutamine amidotransferase